MTSLDLALVSCSDTLARRREDPRSANSAKYSPKPQHSQNGAENKRAEQQLGPVVVPAKFDSAVSEAIVQNEPAHKRESGIEGELEKLR